jgi:hypothetical protein
LKLLFDGNLSLKLVQRLSDAFPGSAHVSDLDLASAGDRAVWDRAAADCGDSGAHREASLGVTLRDRRVSGKSR